MFAAESSAFTQTRHSHPPTNDPVNFHTAATPTAWDDDAAASFAVTNPVLSVGHFKRALLGYSWRAPKLPQTKILLITMHDSEEMLRAAAATGASGYLLKTDAEELLMVALHRLEQGQCFVSPAFDADLAKQLFG